MTEAATDFERRVLRHFKLAMALAVSVYVFCHVMSAFQMPPEAHDLRPSWPGMLFDLLLMIVMFEIPILIYSIAYDNLEARRSLQVAAKICVLVPLMAGSSHLLLAKFHAVVIGETTIAVAGNSPWAADAFPIAKIDRVERRRGMLWHELLFIWYDKIDASCYLYRFDADAQRRLDSLVAELRARGVEVLEVE